jgi:succinyldiaminopimelate transaminase
MDQNQVNQVTLSLKPYPMEALARIRQGCLDRGQKVFDFGTGDPKIPTWPKIVDAIKAAIPAISQYPSVSGTKDLRAAQAGYLHRRFGIDDGPALSIVPTAGSKEAIFHITLSLIGRSGGKKHIIYPDPGYPVYKSSTQFAGGIPYPVALSEASGYLLEPWTLPKEVQRDAAGIWLNYPHNPTGAIADRDYWEKIVEWCHKNDCVLLSDDCYVDIYDTKIDSTSRPELRPICPLALSTDRVLTFMSLSKRSGMTGYRSGFLAGDARILKPHLEARANFGVGMPTFVQTASVVAWNDDTHVLERRKIFSQRMDMAFPTLNQLGLLDKKPEATFYLWCRLPEAFPGNDVDFCLKLAEIGVIASPSQWLSEGIAGYFRLALVPTEQDLGEALRLIDGFVREERWTSKN